MKYEVMSPVAVALENVEQALTTLREDTEVRFGAVVPRINNILLVDAIDSELSETLNHLALLMPGRLFVFAIDSAPEYSDSLFAEVSGIVQKLEGGICLQSEIITLRSGLKRLRHLPALLRSLAYPGAESSLFLRAAVKFRGEFRELLHELLPVVDAVVLNSAEVDGYLDIVRSKEWGRVRIVDTIWIELSPWRERLRDLFEHLSDDWQVRSINARFEVLEAPRLKSANFLFLGWLCSRLALDPISLGANGFECRQGTDMVVPLRISVVQPSDRVGDVRGKWLGKVSVVFALNKLAPGTRSSGENFSIAGVGRSARLEKSESLSLSIALEPESEHWRGAFSRGERKNVDSLSLCAWKRALERFFLVGESYVNYWRSVQVAQSLVDLASAFERYDERGLLS